MAEKKNLLSVLAMLALLALSLWLIFRGQDLSAVWSAIAAANGFFLLLGVVFMALFIGCEAAQTHLILRATGRSVPLGRCYTFSLAGFYFSSITPSSTGGQPAQVFYMARRNIPAALGALDMLLITTCYQLSAMLYALWAWFAAPAVTETLGTGLGVLLGYGLTVTALLTLVTLLFLLRPSLARSGCLFFLRLGSRLRLVRDLPAALTRLDCQIADYRSGTRLLRQKLWLFPALLALSLLQMTFLYLIPGAVYAALGLSGATLPELLSTQALLSVAVGTLPIPGAVGATEAAFLSAFRALFADRLPAAMLLSRGLSFYLPLTVTAFATLLLHLSTRPCPS